MSSISLYVSKVQLVIMLDKSNPRIALSWLLKMTLKVLSTVNIQHGSLQPSVAAEHLKSDSLAEMCLNIK